MYRFVVLAAFLILPLSALAQGVISGTVQEAGRAKW
jgi:hypothetical protein